MNERSYYYDSYTTKFDAVVGEQLVYNACPAVTLDHTFFYPTSGGQPHDVGIINQAAVLDVVVRPEDGAILHILDKELETQQVSASVDWARRFDHMQHHTGQHILSQAFIRLGGAQTIGFHLSDSSVTIDLDQQNLTPGEINAAEQLANDIIWQNRAVKIMEVTPEEALSMPLRKIPAVDGDLVRLIDITDFDLTACGGTHVSRTAEVGLIKIVKQERRSGKLRIEFLCGQRALADYREKHEETSRLSALLTTGITQLAPAVSRLQDDLKQARRELKQQQSILDDLEIQRLLEMGHQYANFTLVTEVYDDRDPGQMRKLANQLARNHDAVTLLGLAGDRSQLLFCKTERAAGSMSEILRVGLEALGSKSGGGNETFAQGVGPRASMDQVKQAIREAKESFLRNLEAHEIE